MKIRRFIYGMFGCMALSAAGIMQGCWHEDLSGCSSNFVQLTLGLESLPGETEMAGFARELDNARYFIYNDSLGTLVADGSIDPDRADGGVYLLGVGELPLGRYTMVVVANDERWSAGTDVPESWEDVSVAAGETGEKSSYVRLYEFSHECSCGFHDYVGLYRTCALVKVGLLNVPDVVKGASVRLTNVAAECKADTTYTGSAMANLDLSDGEWFTVFPSADENGSDVYITLSIEHEGKLHDVSGYIKNAVIKRNSINEIIIDFSDGDIFNPNITVDLDKEWDGTDNVIVGV